MYPYMHTCTCIHVLHRTTWTHIQHIHNRLHNVQFSNELLPEVRVHSRVPRLSGIACDPVQINIALYKSFACMHVHVHYFNTLYTCIVCCYTCMYMQLVHSVLQFRRLKIAIEMIDRLTVEWEGGSLIAVVLPGQELLQDCSRRSLRFPALKKL